MRIFVLGGVGITFVAAGSIFILIGIVTYLSQFMYSGLAWGLVGLVVVLVGGVLLLLTSTKSPRKIEGEGITKKDVIRRTCSLCCVHDPTYSQVSHFVPEDN